MTSQASTPIYASFPSDKLTIGAGVAIFHLATARVVLCYHSRDHYWFLPKGRKNANEDVRHAAEREGFEESGYRNRLLPLPLEHRQTDPDEGHQPFVTEAVWIQLMPLSPTKQYMLSWFVAETVPEEVEASYDGLQGRLYTPPPRFPESMTLTQRIALDQPSSAEVYQPLWHEGTGVDEEELLYKSHLLPIDEARRRLAGSIMEDVVKKGWEAVQLKMRIEAEAVVG